MFAVIAGLFLLPVVTSAAPVSLADTPEEKAAQLLSQLTPEERVGQLFLVEFEGNRIEDNSPIYYLITNYHIGGVVFKRENNNFSSSGDPLLNTWLLVQEVQRTEITSSGTPQENPITGQIFTPALIPLFIGLSQDGDGYPNDQILTDLTPLPNLMAIGATWKPDLAYASGEILGRELGALGINMLFGPSLNINNDPRPELGDDLGVNSFGGNPYWVGEMASQFIAGVHSGSNNQIAVISKRFPGYTGSDRPRLEEIPTIRRTLEQMTGFEFQPFYRVTDLTPTNSSITDGLLLSHAKYQAFQSNVTTTTPPINLDGQALEELIAVNDFSLWHDQGGLIVSDNLWNQAIRRFYEQRAEEFRPALIARDALLAGNDLLVLNGLDPEGEPDPFFTITNTLAFFAQKYRDDQAFARRVDESLLRILTLKYELFPKFTYDTILLSSTPGLELGNSSDIVFDIARQSATLIDPSRDNLPNVLPNAPTLNDRIVIISDLQTYRQCDSCEDIQYPAVDALQLELLRLYGESGSGLIRSLYVSSYSTSDLIEALDHPGSSTAQLMTDIRRSSWLVFLLLGSDQDRPESQAMLRFLSEMPDLIQNRNTVVFSLNAPYLLDATSISQVTAYYGLYSKQPQFLEIAARLLFQELIPSGASPVSVSGAGYLLEEVLSPDTSQTITLRLVPSNQNESGEAGGAVETFTPAVLARGETVLLETSEIVDFNGNPVVDNTAVNFSIISTGIDGATSQREMTSYTLDGIARINHLLDTAGILEVTASIDNALLVSNTLRLEVTVSGGSPNDRSIETPTDAGSAPTETLGDDGVGGLKISTSLIDWLISVIVISFISLFTYQIGAVVGNIRWGVRWGLTSFMGGLLANVYLSFGLPGSPSLISQYDIWGIVVCVTVGCIAGWIGGLIWRSVNLKNRE